jgi:DNA-binding NtrC family response regulator
LAAILIVEDEIDLAEAYGDLLEAHGHSIRVACTVRAAVELIQQVKPEVVILDLNLPDNSGSAVINHMHVTYGLDDIRVIIVSGHSEMAHHADFAETSDLVLNKPVSNDQLLTLVERISRQPSSFNRTGLS